MKKAHTIAYIKRQAKNLKKHKGISHTEALDMISREHGYSNWKHYSRILNQQFLSEDKEIKETFSITFTDWLRRHKNRNSPLGDLASDMIRDKTWPLFDTLSDYENYLSFHHAALEAKKALKRAWRSYTAYLIKRNAPVSNIPVRSKRILAKHEQRKIVFVKNLTPIPYRDRTVEKLNPSDKAWISWDGRKAIPVTVVEVDDTHYSVRIERPLNKAGGINSLFLDEVRSTPELACVNNVTF